VKNNMRTLKNILLFCSMSIMLNTTMACDSTSDTTVNLSYPNWTAFAATEGNPIKCGQNANNTTYPVLCLLPSAFSISTNFSDAQATLPSSQITNNLHFALTEFPTGFNGTTYNIRLPNHGNTATNLYIDITPKTPAPSSINPGNNQTYTYTADLSQICGAQTSCGSLDLNAGTMHCCGSKYKKNASECFY